MKTLALLLMHVLTTLAERAGPGGAKAWKTTLARAGIKDFRWHNIRHTWASWRVQDRIPLHILQELGGWESAEMVRRYAHLSSAHLADYAERLTTLSVVKNFDTKLAQGLNKKRLSGGNPLMYW